MDVDALAQSHGHEGGPAVWRFRRVEWRTPVSADAWPLARVELVHPERGVVTDIASAPGTLGAAFAAAAHILGVAPRLTHYVARSTPTDEGLKVEVELMLELDGAIAAGEACGVDVIDCSLDAWLTAAQALRAGAQGAGTNARSP